MQVLTCCVAYFNADLSKGLLGKLIPLLGRSGKKDSVDGMLSILWSVMLPILELESEIVPKK